MAVVPPTVATAILALPRLGDAAQWCGLTIVSGSWAVTVFFVPNFIGRLPPRSKFRDFIFQLRRPDLFVVSLH